VFNIGVIALGSVDLDPFMLSIDLVNVIFCVCIFLPLNEYTMFKFFDKNTVMVKRIKTTEVKIDENDNMIQSVIPKYAFDKLHINESNSTEDKGNNKLIAENKVDIFVCEINIKRPKGDEKSFTSFYLKMDTIVSVDEGVKIKSFNQCYLFFTETLSKLINIVSSIHKEFSTLLDVRIGVYNGDVCCVYWEGGKSGGTS